MNDMMPAMMMVMPARMSRSMNDHRGRGHHRGRGDDRRGVGDVGIRFARDRGTNRRSDYQTSNGPRGGLAMTGMNGTGHGHEAHRGEC